MLIPVTQTISFFVFTSIFSACTGLATPLGGTQEKRGAGSAFPHQTLPACTHNSCTCGALHICLTWRG